MGDTLVVDVAPLLACEILVCTSYEAEVLEEIPFVIRIEDVYPWQVLEGLEFSSNP